MKLTILLGGFLFDRAVFEGEDILLEYGEVIRILASEGHRLAVVAGGGGLARKYIKAGKRCGPPNSILDDMGILATRLNAYIVISAIGEGAYQVPPCDYGEFLRAYSTGKVVVSGGMSPGQSTDAVATILAEYAGSDLMIKATSVDGIYDKHPGDPNAKMLSRVGHQRLKELIESHSFEPGTYEMFDPVGLRILERSNIPCRIVHGKDSRNILKAAKGEPIGTLIYGG